MGVCIKTGRTYIIKKGMQKNCIPFFFLFLSNPVSRVLSFKTVIYLRRISLYGSSRPSDYRPDRPILSTLLRMGFTWHKALPQCRWALTPPFHPYLHSRRFISVALSLESPPPGFLRHPVLRSSDFPHGRKIRPRDRSDYSVC